MRYSNAKVLLEMYNKLFGKIVTSSVWLEPTPTRLLWITMLALMDRDGFVEMASVRNLAHTARLSLEETEAAVLVLESADKDSSDPENDGKRVERVPGGWLVLNAAKYSQIVTREVARERTRERVRKHRASRNGDVTPRNDDVTPSEEEVDVKTDTEEVKNTVRSSSKSEVLVVFHHWQQVHAHPDSRLSDGRSKLIAKALKDYTVDQLCESISGYKLSPFHMGQNDRGTVYDSIELMLRDAQKIDAGIGFARNPPRMKTAADIRVAATEQTIRDFVEGT